MKKYNKNPRLLFFQKKKNKEKGRKTKVRNNITFK